MAQAPALAPDCAIGFVGLGNMGLPMALRLAAAGYSLHLVDARAEVARDVAKQTGGRALGSVAELGAALAAVILMLPDGQAVRQVLIHDGLLQRLAPGSMVIDMGSCEPSGTVLLGKRLRAVGVDMVD